jgi:hypothetical protein
VITNAGVITKAMNGEISIHQPNIHTITIQSNDAAGIAVKIDGTCELSLPLSTKVASHPEIDHTEKPIGYKVVDFNGHLLYTGKTLRVPANMPVIVQEVYTHRIVTVKRCYMRL